MLVRDCFAASRPWKGPQNVASGNAPTGTFGLGGATPSGSVVFPWASGPWALPTARLCIPYGDVGVESSQQRVFSSGANFRHETLGKQGAASLAATT